MKNIFYFTFCALFLLGMTACKDSSTSGTASKTGTMRVKMTDSPALYDAVYIVVDSVTAHLSSGDTLSGWITLNRTQSVYNLLQLVNGIDTVIGSKVLSVGTYSQLRLHLGEGSNVVVNGVSHPLTVPSGLQSGVKLNIHATIQPDILYTLTLDFDANKSIVISGGDTYSLKPVIRVISTTSSGNIIGMVLPVSAKGVLWSYASADTVSTYADATSGSFKLLYLTPGTYSVLIMSQNLQYSDTTLTGVVVTAGSTQNLGIITLTGGSSKKETQSKK